MKHNFLNGLILLGLNLVLVSSIHAQWTSQSLQLNPGWNAVYLSVDPEPHDLETVFGEWPVESVWLWNRRFNPVQFIHSPDVLLPENPDWLVYAPAESPLAARRSLFRALGGKCYLVKVAESSPTNVTLSVAGRPVVRSPEWVSDSFNLVGFDLGDGGGPSFQEFFSGSSAHAGQVIHRLSPAGTWEPVMDPAGTRMRSGEAFWIWTRSASAYAGPLRLVLEERHGLNFGSVLLDQVFEIHNDSPESEVVWIRRRPSDSPPHMEVPALAGDVPLDYWRYDPTSGFADWTNLTGTVIRQIEAGSSIKVRVAVRRPDMAHFSLPAGVTESLYQNLLEVRNADGTVRFLVPLTAQNTGSQGIVSALGGSGGSSEVEPHLLRGLWVGSAVIDRVSQPISSDPTALYPAAASFQLRLLVHVDTTGRARLLQRVLQKWQDGTTKPAPDDPSKRVLDVSGRFVLLTNHVNGGGYQGAGLRDGQPFSRRFSTAAFSFRDPIDLDPVAAGEFGTGTLECLVRLDFDDPLNPFKHRYHPAHNNLDAAFSGATGEGDESFTIDRSIEMEFTDTDPENTNMRGWGDKQVGGIYHETILGLHYQPLHVEGTFKLHRISLIGELK